MSIITYICNDVKEYAQNGMNIILQLLLKRNIICQVCFRELKIHSSYQRNIKDENVTIIIYILRCRNKCDKGQALLPDFISPNKQYSIREIEKIMSTPKTERISEIDTKASESTVRRWKSQLPNRIIAAVSVIKSIYINMHMAVSELALDDRGGFFELESLLDMAPKRIKHCGATLALANLWLNARSPPTYI